MNYYMPTRLMTGRDSVGKHAALLSALGKRCLIVTGAGSAKKCGALDDVTAALERQGVEYGVFDRIRQNPTVSVCAAGGQAARACGAAFIIGVGGGSPLDSAKAIGVFASNPELTEEALYAGAWPNPPKPCVLVGTTAGTGSEVTAISVLTGSAGRKRGLKDARLYAAYSFGDAKYTMTLPRAFTLSTGVDALSHCIESYFNRKADEVSRAFAVRGARLLIPSLGAAAELADGEPDAALRERLYEASILGGLAINTTGTCFPHNVGYYLTEHYGVPHGTACAVFQPALLDHVEQCAPEAAAAFYREAGTDGAALRALVRRVVPELGITMTEEEIDAQLPRWENNATVSATLGGMAAETIRAILRERFA